MANCPEDPSVVSEINTSTDACSVGAPCVPATADVCLVSNCACGCNPCQCGSSAQASPTPFYNQACASQESHTQVLVQQTFITAVATGSAFNMPACGVTISGVILPGVQKLQVGSYIWNVTYGYLLVTRFDYSNSTVSLKNECNPGNASPGTLIPACTMFNVVDPPYTISDECGDGSSFLATDFVAPGVGNTVVIDVTNLIGITVGSLVQIGAGIYEVTFINSATSINIRDNGAGAPALTTVYAKDALGHCISPISPFSENPCAETPVPRGTLVVCNRGIPLTLDATDLHQIPVCIDPVTNEVEFQSLSIPTDQCTYLTACLLLINGTLTYTIQVNDTSLFEEGQLIVIKYGGIETYYWRVTTIISPTQMLITSVSGTQTLDASICDEVAVCEAPCCTDLQYQITDLCVPLSANEAGSVYVTTVAPLALYVGATESLYLENPTSKNMDILVHVDYMMPGYFNVQNNDYASVNFEPWFGLAASNIGVAVVPTQNYLRQLWQTFTFGWWGAFSSGLPIFTYNYYWSNSHHYTVQRTIAPGQRLTINAHVRLYYASFDHGAAINLSTGLFTLEGAGTQIHMIGSNIY